MNCLGSRATLRPLSRVRVVVMATYRMHVDFLPLAANADRMVVRLARKAMSLDTPFPRLDLGPCMIGWAGFTNGQ